MQPWKVSSKVVKPTGKRNLSLFGIDEHVFFSGYASAIRSNIPSITTVRVYAESSQPINSRKIVLTRNPYE